MYDQAIAQGKAIPLRFLKFLFTGTPRSGKSTLLRRLSGKQVTNSEISCSTGVAEITNVVISKVVSSLVSIAKDADSLHTAWTSIEDCNSESESSVSTSLDEVARYIFNIIHQNQADKQSCFDDHSVESGSISLESNSSVGVKPAVSYPDDDIDIRSTTIGESDPDTTSSSLNIQKSEVQVNPEVQEIDSIFQELYDLFEAGDMNKLTHLLHTMMNMVDAGGQSAYLEMLPTLTIGPALYGIIFKLNQELAKKYPVQFCEKDIDIEQEDVYSAEEVILQCLCSIDCFAANHSDQKSVSLLFGTFRDKTTEFERCKIQSDIKKILSNTKFMQSGQDLLRKASGSNFAYEIDNVCVNDDETQKIQKDIESIIEKVFPARQIPASWLMFYVVLRRLSIKNRTVTFVQCEEIAVRLKMRPQLRQALWFFHHDIGCLMYYSNIESLRNTVICEPQVVFDSITIVVIQAFDKKSYLLPPKTIEDFKEKGQFCLSDLKTLYNKSNACLNPSQLVDILEHHNIVVRIDNTETTESSDPKFLMPAVLKMVIEDKLDDPECLMIYFKCGYVPFGIFCGETAYLLSHCKSFQIKWVPSGDVKKNSVSFIIDGAFTVTLLSKLKFQKVHVAKVPNAFSKLKLQDICSHVRQTIIETLETVISRLKYRPFEKDAITKEIFSIAFSCCCSDTSENHLMTTAIETNEIVAYCTKSSCRFQLSDKQRTWFEVRCE